MDMVRLHRLCPSHDSVLDMRSLYRSDVAFTSHLTHFNHSKGNPLIKVVVYGDASQCPWNAGTKPIGAFKNGMTREY